MKLAIQKGTTSKSIDIFIQDSSVTTGAGLTGLVYNSAGLTAYYHRPGAAAAAITLATLASATAAYSSGGFIEIDATNMPGMYRLDLPDAVLASGVNEVSLLLKGATNMVPVPIEIQLTSVNLNDGVRAGLTALPSVAQGNAGALLTAGTGTAQLSVASGRAQADVAYWSGAAVATPGVSGVPKVDVTHWTSNAVAATSVNGVPKVDVTHFGGSAGAFAGGIPQVNLAQWLGAAPLALTAQRVEVLVGAMSNATVTAAAVATDAIDADALATNAVAEIVTAVWAKVCEDQGSYTAQQIMSIALAALAGRTADSGATFKTPNNVATRIAATLAGNERTGMTLTPSAGA